MHGENDIRCPGTATTSITIHNAREHNLRNIDVTIPREAFTVITGVSGSGKSTLAFDIIFNEGQRRYLESLNAYARQFVQPAARPDVDAIYGIPPTVAIEQRTSRGGRKSTVATLTEIYHFLRLLYQKLGTQFCPTCDVAIEPQTPASIAERLLKQHKGCRIMLLAPLVVARKGYYTELAKWANARGYKQLRVDGEMLTTYQWPRLNRFKEHTIELPVAQIEVQKDNADLLERNVIKALDLGKGLVHVLDLDSTAKKPRVQVFSVKRACPSCGTSFSELDPRLFSFNSKHGWCEDCFGTGLALEGFDEEQSGEEAAWNEWLGDDTHACETCHGQRLNPIALHVRFRDLNIAQLDAPGHRRHRRLRQQAAPQQARSRDRARPHGRDQVAHGVPAARRPGLSTAGPLGADAVGRRGAAHPARRATRLKPAGRVLRARRAHHRPASARQQGAARRAGRAREEPQHAGGGRARRRHHSPRRSRHRPRAGRGRARRRSGRRRHRRRAEEQPGVDHRSLPRESAAAFGRAASRHRRARAATLARQDRAAQRAQRRHRHAGRPPGGGHRRVGLRQVHGGARRAVRESQAPGRQGPVSRAAPNTRAHRRRRRARCRTHRPRARGGPDTHRQDAALLPGDLHRLLG